MDPSSASTDGLNLIEMVIRPVVLVQTKQCHYQAKPCKICGKPKSNPIHRKPDKGGTCVFARQQMCANCGLAKANPAHYGAPESFNVGAGREASIYREWKSRWAAIFIDLLDESGLPKNLSRVLAEGVITFPSSGARDQGNFRVVIEKALGDALQEGGWLSSDDWTRYEFGQLSMCVEPGVSETRITLFAQ